MRAIIHNKICLSRNTRKICSPFILNERIIVCSVKTYSVSTEQKPRWTFFKMGKFFSEHSRVFSGLLNQKSPMKKISCQILSFNYGFSWHNYYLRKTRKISSPFTYVPARCRGEPYVRPRTNNAFVPMYDGRT